jgi:hypothetical protein
MASNVILDSIRKDESESIRGLIKSVKFLATQHPNQDEAAKITTLLQGAEQGIGAGKKEKRKVLQITFNTPEHSLEEWCAHL